MHKLKTMLFVRKEIGMFCIYETSIYEICICLLFCCALDTRFCYNNFCCCWISSFLISTHTRDFLFLGPILQCVYFVWVQSASVLRLRNPSGLSIPYFCRCFDRRFYWTHRRWELCCCFFIFTLKRLMGKPKNIKIENIDTEKDHKSLQSLQRIYSLYMTDTIFPRFIKTYSM